MAIVQHEFGIYGGADGVDVLDVLDALTVPAIVVLHTVLTAPTRHQQEVLERVIDRAAAVVTMTQTARDRLLAGYPVDAAKVMVIPHGPRTRSPPPPCARTGPPTILTWGLLGPGKGIESVIDVLSQLRTLTRGRGTRSSARPTRRCSSATARPTGTASSPGPPRPGWPTW